MRLPSLSGKMEKETPTQRRLRMLRTPVDFGNHGAVADTLMKAVGCCSEKSQTSSTPSIGHTVLSCLV